MTILNFNLSKSNLPYFIEKLQSLDLEKTNYVANVTEKKTKRTSDQNSRLWKLYTELGNHIGEHQDRVHELMGYKFLRYQDEINGEIIERVKSTTKLTTAEMSEYQDKIEQWANTIGFIFNEN